MIAKCILFVLADRDDGLDMTDTQAVLVFTWYTVSQDIFGFFAAWPQIIKQNVFLHGNLLFVKVLIMKHVLNFYQINIILSTFVC